MRGGSGSGLGEPMAEHSAIPIPDEVRQVVVPVCSGCGQPAEEACGGAHLNHVVTVVAADLPKLYAHWAETAVDSHDGGAEEWPVSGIEIPNESVDAAVAASAPVPQGQKGQSGLRRRLSRPIVRAMLAAAYPAIRSSVLESAVEDVAKAMFDEAREVAKNESAIAFPAWDQIHESARKAWRRRARNALGLPSEGKD